MFHSAKKRSRRYGIDFNIELFDIAIPDVCPLLGIKLTATQGSGKLKSNASLDRIDNSRGYVKGNVWVISHQANTMKNNSSIQELLDFSLNSLIVFSQYGRR